MANPKLETVRHHMLLYSNRGPKGRFDSELSPNPRPLAFNLHEEPLIDRQLQEIYLASYLMYEQGEIVVDKVLPPERFGDLIDNDTFLVSARQLSTRLQSVNLNFLNATRV